jgi:hypothetical protein
MPGNANAAVQYDHRRVRPPLEGLPSSAAKPASAEIAAKIRRRVSREVSKLYQGTGRGSAGAEQ